jgi:medium-chain acyl-[acyl-carrier-protein] hydrolase
MVAEGLEWRESARIRSYESDARGMATVATICNIMQECASNHANHLGFGVDELNERGAIWALSRIGVEILRRPAIGERVTVNTWLLESRGPFAIREFSILDEQENILVQSKYAWLAIDLITKRSVRPETLMKDMPINTKKKPLSNNLKKIRFPEKPISLTPIHVRKSDLDIQSHVNNSRYIAWIEDALDEYNVKKSSIYTNAS